MPPQKKQKSTAAKENEPDLQDQDDEGPASLPHKNDKENGKEATKDTAEERDTIEQTSQIPDDEYICVPRPLFDYKAEQRAQEHDAAADDEYDEMKKMKNTANAEFKANIVYAPAKDFPDRKWVMLWDGWKQFKNYVKRAKYCDPDRFEMHISNDFEGYGFQELLENMVNAFETALKKKDNLVQMWAIVSAIGMWLNEVDQGPLIAIDQADELKPDGKFLDVPLVITMWLEWSKDLPQYGIGGEAVDWRPHAAAYFQKAKYDASKGISSAKKLLNEMKDVDEGAISPKTAKDPWGWKKELSTYKSSYAIKGKIGGTKHDITLMSRTQRAGYSFDHEDPLKDVPLKVLKEGNLDFED
ncbi:hypothetical protein HDU86_003003 [Geranomyces michiganensis]|nr:hypothetical protein HDU86_003003 [Geranomyces michiganensis]